MPITSPATEAKPASDEPVAKRNPDPVSGSFYASKLLWSADGKLYFLGNHVKVNLNTNKFTGSGKFSFLDKVHFLVIDGVSIEKGRAVKLEETKYNLVMLDSSEGARKYGDDGKSGVLEITLAE